MYNYKLFLLSIESSSKYISYRYDLKVLLSIYWNADLRQINSKRYYVVCPLHSQMHWLIFLPYIFLLLKLNKSQSMQCRQLLCNVTLATFGFTLKIISWRGVRHCLSAARTRGNYATRIGPLWCMWQHIKSDHWQSRKYSNTHTHLCGYIIYVCVNVCVETYEDIHLNAFRWMNTCARHCVASLFKVNRLQILCALRFQIIQTHQASEKGA